YMVLLSVCWQTVKVVSSAGTLETPILGCGCVSLISSNYPTTCVRVTPASTVGGSSTTGSVLLLSPEGVV
ncbi:hypothetical protein A2U01_0065345, partial [Trifolium medium]|nr:hypothetical protein [Trifolium medium]